MAISVEGANPLFAQKGAFYPCGGFFIIIQGLGLRALHTSCFEPVTVTRRCSILCSGLCLVPGTATTF